MRATNTHPIVCHCPRIHFGLFLLVLGALAAARGYTGGDFHLQIVEALHDRDSCVAALGLSPAEARQGLGTPSLVQGIQARLEEDGDVQNPWNSFFLGVTKATDSRVDASYFFAQALELTKESPGATWVLFTEFDRYGQVLWAENALGQLEKQFLEQGATRVWAVSQTLMRYAVEHESDKNGQVYKRYYSWIPSFDPFSPWPMVRSAMLSFPSSPAQCVKQIRSLSALVSESWQLQTAVVSVALSWLLTAGLLFVAAVLSVLFARHFSGAVHRLVDLFPLEVGANLRHWLVAGILVSTACLGWAVAAWLAAFLLWPYLSRRERVMAGSCMALVVISPVVVGVAESVDLCRDAGQAPALYTQAVYEPYHGQLEQSLDAAVERQPGDALARAGRALAILKSGNAASALTEIAAARAMRPNDPVVLTLQGIASFRCGMVDSARACFERCVRRHPRFAPGHLNLGRLYVESSQTLEGMNHINDAARLQPGKVRAFTDKNDDYFPRQWPALRQFMLPDYTPGYFWTSLFPERWGGLDSAAAAWGMSFAGIGPFTSFVLFVLLFCGLLWLRPLRRASGGPEVRRLFACEACGSAYCRKCGAGSLCARCAPVVLAGRDEAQRRAAREGIRSRSQNRKRVLRVVLDIAFPGAGALLGRTPLPWSAPVLMLASSAAYATYWCAAHEALAYPWWVARRPIGIVVWALALFSLFFIIRGAARLLPARTSDGDAK